VADYNPVTYLLAGLRALISDGWVLADLLPAVGAVALVALVSFYLAFSALRSRVRGS
jgi:ABC-2 type transport system permease protein